MVKGIVTQLGLDSIEQLAQLAKADTKLLEGR